jgi:hypothetical protein
MLPAGASEPLALIPARQCVLDVFITISPGGPKAGGFYIKITLQNSCEITEQQSLELAE